MKYSFVKSRPGSRTAARLVSVAALIVGVLIAAAPAAVSAPAESAEPWTVSATPVGPSASDVGAQYFSSCFGYRGEFRSGTTVVAVDWSTDVDECFGIAPNRTIWHTWPGAGRWHQMPDSSGRADDTGTIWLEWANGDRRVSAWVNGTGNWCQNYWAGSGWAANWWNC
ncbi:hypothetical protein GCM10027436_32320 [Actinophytocola sediminis]